MTANSVDEYLLTYVTRCQKCGGNYPSVSTYMTSTSATAGRQAQICRSDIAAEHRSTLNVADRCEIDVL